MRKVVGLIVFTAAFYQAAWGRDLTDAERGLLVRSVMQSCMTTQRAAPENVGLSEQFLTAYCRFYLGLRQASG